jgi:hypothetical protein
MAELDTELLHETANGLKALTQKMESAFLKDEDGNVDYAGHKLTHKQQKETQKEYEKSRALIFRNIITWLAIGALTIIGSSAAQIFIQALRTAAAAPTVK